MWARGNALGNILPMLEVTQRLIILIVDAFQQERNPKRSAFMSNLALWADPLAKSLL
jgi:hypothetical protein